MNEKSEIGDPVFSNPIKAGKRTYFFDVKSTKEKKYYLTITESKRSIGDDGKFTYEKHKIFLYKEDFEKFVQGLNSAIDYINTHDREVNTFIPPVEDIAAYTQLQFEDLSN